MEKKSVFRGADHGCLVEMKTTPDKAAILDLYFMDARCKLIDIAAFLDRLDRHRGDADFRHPAFLTALRAMQAPDPGKSRVQTVLESLSDKSTTPADTAGTQGASGAPPQPAANR